MTMRRTISAILVAAIATTAAVLAAGPASATAIPFKPGKEGGGPPTTTYGGGSDLSGDNESAVVTHYDEAGAKDVKVVNSGRAKKSS